MRNLINKLKVSLITAGAMGLCAPSLSLAEETITIPANCTEELCLTPETGNSNCPPGMCSCLFEETDPFVYLDAEYLFWQRNTGANSQLVIGGAEPLAISAASNEIESGLRIQAGVIFESLELAFSWEDVNSWVMSRNGQLINGVSFDTDVGGSFPGANFINGNTAFSSLFAAAEFNPGGVPDETLEDEGLGPAVGFVDAAPTFQLQHRSDLQDYELIAKVGNINSRMKFGVGWRHVDFDENSIATLTGTFRAVDNAVGANGGLSHTALTSATGGNLTLISGTADGFDDETMLLGPAGPDLLRLQDTSVTSNSLNGIQFSLDVLLLESERFLIDTVLKTGVYNNQATGTRSETYSGIFNDDSVYGRTLNDSSNSVAYVGQIGLGTMYRVNDVLRLRFGWDVLFLSGVALSPDQTVINNSVYQINNDGSVIVNGGRIGLEMVY